MLPNNIPGQEDGPSAPDNWKRAVYRPAPSRFTVEMLPPVKLGGNYNFHMRICPITRGDRSSVSSRGSNTEYDILRRWEDCLIFQDSLEREYRRLATSKRQRLVAGKGVRKNGMYLHSDRASSWESLPPGPEPDSVAQDIHDLIPRLTKKGTMFRASQATIDQRQVELTAMITALWQDSVPTLLEDFRKERIVTDFFGFWRRDQDIEKKNPLNKTPSPSVKAPRSSVSSSVFSSYFSSSGDSRESLSRRARAHSSASSDSSSLPSTSSARSSISVSINDEQQPLEFGHNPQSHQYTVDDNLKAMRLNLIAAAAKKLREGEANLERPDSRATINRGPRESWMTTASGMSFVDDMGLTLPEEDDENDTTRWRMSNASIATFRTEVSSEGVIPRYYVPEHNPARMSTATFMTDVSADGILPRDNWRDSVLSDTDSVLDSHFSDAFPRPCSYVPPQPALRNAPFSPTNSLPLLSPGISICTTSPAASRLHTQFSGLSVSPPSPKMPVTPVNEKFYQRRDALAKARAPSPSPSVISTAMSMLSDTTIRSTFSDSTGSTVTPSLYSFHSARSHLSTTTAASLPPLVIKAAHNNSIILLRVDDDLSLGELRGRLQNKFLGQEGVQLSDNFSLAYMIPASPTKARSFFWWPQSGELAFCGNAD
ncbi:hypothetical protein MIND_00264300 [Mycena indigotica]|uniref:PX domain-containing protein n=1 Tax=Mycena indigotica TaxID=2126181 RepID=A0A8H6T965_9AGAR|nr:uncharacterized protein MIND_00264300 [Mycena indigotica]KAF7312506.1 hypothetical protein MIND_00264300 [Mycena indigotica]